MPSISQKPKVLRTQVKAPTRESLMQRLKKEPVVTLDRAECRCALQALREADRAKTQLERMQRALEYLSKGCAYPRAIRRRLKEVSEGTWEAPRTFSRFSREEGIDALWRLSDTEVSA